MDANVIKEYLVSLGFSIDNAQFAKFQGTIKDVGKKLEDVATGMSKQVVKSGTLIISTLASIATATVTMMDKVAQADLGYQKFALHMYMSTAAAKKFKIATDALGESMIDIARNPELLQRYRQLMGEAQGMETPAGAGDQLKYLRDMRFEFTRLKVEAIYGMQWITYYLFKMMGVPIKNLKDGMKKFNDWIQEKMPVWTNKIAKALSWVFQLLNDIWRPIKAISVGFYQLFNMLSGFGKASVISFGLILASIFFPVTMKLGALLLLLDDFFAYLDGRKSSDVLAPIWQLTIDAINILSMGLMNLLIIARHIKDLTLHGETYDETGAGSNEPGKTQKSLQQELDEADAQFKGIQVNKPDSLKWTGAPAPAGFKPPAIGNEDIRAAAKIASAQLGIPAARIYGQWGLETAGFTSPLFKRTHNLAGIKNAKGEYETYGSINEATIGYVQRMQNKRYSDVAGATSDLDYASRLKSAGYWGPDRTGKGATIPEYAAGITRYGKGYGATGPVTNNVTVNVAQSNATPEQIKAATMRAMEESYRKLASRQMRDFQGVNG